MMMENRKKLIVIGAVVIGVILVYFFLNMFAPSSIDVEENRFYEEYYWEPSGDYGLTERLIVKTGSISVEVENVESSVEEIKQLVDYYDGYVSYLNVYETSTGKQASVTVRIPSDSFDEAMDNVGLLGKEKGRTEDAEDVTEQMIDIDSRLNNLRAEEERLLELYNKTTEISDIISLEERIWEVRQEIEMYESEKEYLEKSVSLSSISISFTQKTSLTSIDLSEEFNVGEIIVDGVKMLIASVKFLIGALFALLIPALLAYGVYKVFYRKRKRF